MTELFDSLPSGPVLRTFVQYLIAFCSRSETASCDRSDRFMRLIVPDKTFQFRDTCLNRYGEIRPKAIGGGIFDILFAIAFRPEVANVVIPDAVVEQTDVGNHVKFGDSRSNRS